MKKILVVDNHPATLELMSNLLEKEGHEVITVGDSLSALEILKKYTPDAIFLDLIMPNINGKKLCKIIKSIPKLKETFIIIISGIAAERGHDLIKLGADACIAKGPFNKMAKHILHILDQTDNIAFDGTSKKIFGLEDIYPRQVTKDLLSSMRHLEVMLDNISEGILEVTLEGNIIYANPTVFSLSGLPEEELLTLDVSELFDYSYRNRIKELIYLVGDGPQKITDDSPVVMNGKQVSMNIFLLKDDEDESIIIVLHDISKRKRMEDRLLQAQKMEAMGILASGISHDFNNLLTVITGHTELAQEYAESGSDLYHHLSETHKACLSTRDLIQQFVFFSANGIPVKTIISIKDLGVAL